MSLQFHNFSNGLQLVYEQSKDSHTTAIVIFVKVGAIYEPVKLHGISHFIEHMMFKGTPSLPTPESISRVFDKIGAYFNAFTTFDHTGYIVKSDSDYYEICFKTLVDMLLHSNFDKKEFTREKNVIIRDKDNTEDYINTKIYELIFHGSSLEHDIGGEREDIEKYDYNKAYTYYKNFYNPGNMVISICSDKSFDYIKNIIQKSVISKGNKNTFLLQEPYIPNFNITKYKSRKLGLISRNVEQIYIAIGFTTEGMYSDDYYTLNVLDSILAGNMSSILFINLREKGGVTYSISIDFTVFKETGCFIILTSVDKDKFIHFKNKKGALPIIIDSLNQILNNITNQEFEVAKGYLKGSNSLEAEDKLNKCCFNGINTLFNTEDKNIPMSNIYDTRYKGITKNDVRKVIQKYITLNNLSSYYIGKNITKDKSLIRKIERIEDALQGNTQNTSIKTGGGLSKTEKIIKKLLF